MRVADLHYDLPEDRVARHPAARRDDARLLVVDPLRDLSVRDLPRLVTPGTLLVVNDTRVMPARLIGHKPSGGRVELLLVEPVDGERWLALARASKRLREGTEIVLPDGAAARIEGGPDDEGLFTLRIAGDAEALMGRHGQMPLPPYLGRDAEAGDAERYQTVFARASGASAAPTAGLHFTPALLEALADAGVERASITLHVGPGTFRPIKVDDLDDHPMHRERFEVPEATVAAIAAARARSAPVLAVGTTVVRALESAADPDRPGRVRAHSGATRLLIQPGYRFRVVDALLTNFHLPGSTLLALVYAFGGVAAVRRAYDHAIASGYRFYSYGDAMFLSRRAALEGAP